MSKINNLTVLDFPSAVSTSIFSATQCLQGSRQAGEGTMLTAPDLLGNFVEEL